jgi:hypothetical protein
MNKPLSIDLELDEIISYLDNKGVIHLKKVFNKEHIEIIKDIYTQSWLSLIHISEPTRQP